MMTIDQALSAMRIITETTCVATNGNLKAVIDMTGECVACNRPAKLAIRKTTAGKFALIRTIPREDGSLFLLRVFHTVDHGKNYLATITRNQ